MKKQVTGLIRVKKAFGRSARRRILLPVVSAAIFLTLLGLGTRPQAKEGMYEDVYVLAVQDVQVVAHRAGADEAPENTLAALERAIAVGADVAEIDVQQTRDGVLIVMHDESLRRTTGLNQKVWDTDYEQTHYLDAGAWYSADYGGEGIPTLEEMLRAAKGRIHLMIELKSTGHEERMVENAVALIQKADMVHESTIASSALSMLSKSKELVPELETVYIGEVLYPELGRADYLDGYSIHSVMLTQEDVSQARQEGRQLYAWTVNSKNEMNRALALGVDGLVTDDPRLAIKLLDREAMQTETEAEE